MGGGGQQHEVAEVAVFAADDAGVPAPGRDLNGAVAVLGHQALSTLGAAHVALDRARAVAADAGDVDILAACDEAGRLLGLAATVIREGVVLQLGWTPGATLPPTE